MLTELKFVQGAVGKKEFIPAITHFCIENGTVRAYNGTIALSTPINCDINCKPKASPMVQAIGKCEETISLSLTAAGRLAIKSGAFKAFIECIEEANVHVQPEGEEVKFNGEVLLQGLRKVHKFIGTDASRPWANGVLVSGESLYATNNVCLIQFWMGAGFPHQINIPKMAVDEILRIGLAPSHAQVTETSITFHYPGGKWLRTQLFETRWPDLNRVLDKHADVAPISKDFYVGLKNLRPFVNKFGQVFINSGGFMHTNEDVNEGASYDIDWEHKDCIYNLEMLMLLEDTAEQVDFSAYPAPCLFYGDRVRGAIIGMKLREESPEAE